jgi:hypothetical protein
MSSLSSRRWIVASILLLLLLACASAASAQTRAWLDRDRIALGETTTLNIETDQALASSPDYSPLLGAFQLSGNTSSRQFEMVNGAGRMRVLFAVALRPLREGLVSIPALAVGNRRTQPLTLTVTTSAATPARAGDDVFIEAEADAQDPYVQQAVGYTLRLFYAQPLSGQLEQPPPEGASLQRVGEDAQYSREVGGRVYNVLERRFLLIPEHSGTLAIPAARFEGRGADGFFDDLIGGGGRELHANGAPRFLDVHPVPANAPQPWLPLRALGLRYLATPQAARAGEAATVTIEATADGATAAQMPELQLPAGAGAQVFADPAQSDEAFAGGRPQVRVARRFSIVPSHAGTLRITGPKIRWWDVRAGIARTATLPDISLQVAPGADGFASADASGSVAQPARAPAHDGVHVPGVQGLVRAWPLATVLFAALWLVTLAWALQRRTVESDTASTMPHAGPRASTADLKRVLEHGDLGEVADVLCAMAVPPATDLDGLRTMLGDARQVAAIDALQRARWADGDRGAARAALRVAFKGGPHWREARVEPAREPLPPLYPPG